MYVIQRCLYKHLLCTLGSHYISATFVGPTDMTVTVGSAATFTCTITDSQDPCFRWKYKAPEARLYQSLHSGDELAPGCKCNVTFSNDRRTSSLTINNVQLTDGGLYKCSDCWTAESADAKLSVIGT